MAKGHKKLMIKGGGGHHKGHKKGHKKGGRKGRGKKR